MEVVEELQAPDALPSWEEPYMLLDRRLGRPRSPSGCCGEENNFMRFPRIKPDSSVIKP
jgi:hypothetical protein